MSVTTIRNGFNIPLHGGIVNDVIVDGPAVKQVALKPQEAIGIKVKMLVQEGDAVKIGTPLFCDKRDPEVLFTSPGAGTVTAINRVHSWRRCCHCRAAGPHQPDPTLGLQGR